MDEGTADFERIDSKHHVAWADRIGLNKTWAKNIMSCNESFGTDYYISRVRALHNSIVDVKNGPKLRTIIDDYFNGELKEWEQLTLDRVKKDNPKKASNRGWLDQKKADISYRSYEKLYSYIVQTLENNNFCFYESSIEEDEIL